MRGIEISVVVPAFNEGDLLASMLARIGEVLSAESEHFEIIVVNDGSTDGTQNIVQEMARSSPFIVPVVLSRNFGKEAAMLAGLTTSRGECVVFIDADLQHPPEIIPKMLEEWRNGFDVVNARKSFRGKESYLHRSSAALFNWIISKAVGENMSGSSDFKLIDRLVAEALLMCSERHRFFRGLVTWVGFRATAIEFEVAERPTGSSKWNTAMLLRYSLNNIVEFSSFPLKLVAYVGFGVALFGGVLLTQTLFNYFQGRAAIGFTTVIAIQILTGGMIFMAMSALSLYISNIYDEQKGRPNFIIRKARKKHDKKLEMNRND